MQFAKKNALVIGILLTVLLMGGLFLVVRQLQQQQENRSQAQASTVLSFTPTSSTASPLQHQPGSTIALDVMLDPGVNIVSSVRLIIDVPATHFAVDSFVPNTAVFSEIIEGPVIANGRASIVMTTGTDSTKAIRNTITRVGTLNIRALQNVTTTPVAVRFSTDTVILSIASTDGQLENVLSSSQPAYISLSGITPTLTRTPTPSLTRTPTPSLTRTPTPSLTGSPTPSLTRTPTPTITPTRTPTLTPTRTPSPTLTPTQAPNETRVSLQMILHGIGVGGDNSNPTGNSLSNKNPLHRERQVSVTVLNSQNVQVANQTGIVTYSSTTEDFRGTISLGTNVPTGDYIVRVKTDQYLRKQLPGIVRLTAGTLQTLLPVTVIAGDARDDNTLNILDYNMLLGCFTSSTILTPRNCTETNSVRTDLNDDGAVNLTDLNLFVRELLVQYGD